MIPLNEISFWVVTLIAWRPPRPKRGAITTPLALQTGLRPVTHFWVIHQNWLTVVNLFFAERQGLEPWRQLPVDRLAICSITTLAPLLFKWTSTIKIAVANVTFHYLERKLFFYFFVSFFNLIRIFNTQVVHIGQFLLQHLLNWLNFFQSNVRI